MCWSGRGALSRRWVQPLSPTQHSTHVRRPTSDVFPRPHASPSSSLYRVLYSHCTWSSAIPTRSASPSSRISRSRVLGDRRLGWPSHRFAASASAHHWSCGPLSTVSSGRTAPCARGGRGRAGSSARQNRSPPASDPRASRPGSAPWAGRPRRRTTPAPARGTPATRARTRTPAPTPARSTARAGRGGGAVPEFILLRSPCDDALGARAEGGWGRRASRARSASSRRARCGSASPWHSARASTEQKSACGGATTPAPSQAGAPAARGATREHSGAERGVRGGAFSGRARAWT